MLLLPSSERCVVLTSEPFVCSWVVGVPVPSEVGATTSPGDLGASTWVTMAGSRASPGRGEDRGDGSLGDELSSDGVLRLDAVESSRLGLFTTCDSALPRGGAARWSASMCGTRLRVGEAIAVDAVPGVTGEPLDTGLPCFWTARAATGTTVTGAGGGARLPPIGVCGWTLIVDGVDLPETEVAWSAGPAANSLSMDGDVAPPPALSRALEISADASLTDAGTSGSSG